jgi:hypothetical protein
MPIMKRIIPLLLTGWVYGCINVPEIETGSSSSPADAGGSSTPDSGTPQEDLEVTLVDPSDTAYTSTSVSISVEVRGGVPDTVQLLRDGEVLTTLTSPFRYTWDTTSIEERSYTLTARALRGNKRFDSEPVTVVVDRTNLLVASRSPGTGTSNVDYSQPIQVVFTKPVKASTVSDITVSFAVAGVLMDKTLSLSNDGRTLTLKPLQRPALPAKFSIGLSRGITDLAGNALVVPTTAWNFEVPDWYTFSDSLEAVMGSNTTQADPTIIVSNQDEPIVAWSEQIAPGGRSSIFVYKWDGKAFAPMGSSINGTAVGSAFRPSLALLGDGNPVVAWQESDGFNENIYVKRWTGTAWQTVGTGALSGENDTRPSPSPTPATNPVIAAHGNDIHVAWQEMTIDNYSAIQVWTSLNGTPFSRAGNTSGGLSAVPMLTSGYNPSIILNESGRPIVAFHEQTLEPQSPTRIYAFELAATGNWQHIIPISSGDSIKGYTSGGLSVSKGKTFAKNCSLAMDENGALYLAWAEEPSIEEASDIHVFRSTDHQSWTKLGSSLNAINGYTSAYIPKLQVLSQDKVGVLWIEFSWYKEGFSHIFSSTWNKGSWVQTTPPQGLNEDQSSASQIQFSSDRYGRNLISYLKDTPPQNIVILRQNN